VRSYQADLRCLAGFFAAAFLPTFFPSIDNSISFCPAGGFLDVVEIFILGANFDSPTARQSIPCASGSSAQDGSSESDTHPCSSWC
jgi:hypothetical protein